MSMKSDQTTNRFVNVLKSLTLVVLFFTFAVNVQAQDANVNKLTAPQVVTAVGSIDPGVIVGNPVKVDDANTQVTYEWQSATDEFFTHNLITNLANTKDYDPGVVTTTTFFRRVVTIVNSEDGSKSVTKTSGIKIVVN